jgi:hypothetical protein
MSNNDFFRLSKREGELVDIPNLDDPDQIRRTFTAMTPERRIQSLANLDSHLRGTFEQEFAPFPTPALVEVGDLITFTPAGATGASVVGSMFALIRKRG